MIKNKTSRVIYKKISQGKPPSILMSSSEFNWCVPLSCVENDEGFCCEGSKEFFTSPKTDRKDKQRNRRNSVCWISTEDVFLRYSSERSRPKDKRCMRSARQKLSKISSVVESTQRLRINQHLDKTFWSTRFYAGNSRAKEIIVTENLLFDHGAMGCWNWVPMLWWAAYMNKHGCKFWEMTSW